MKVQPCPLCDMRLRVVHWEDDTYAGECVKCGVFWPLILNDNNDFVIEQRGWEEPCSR
jgi:Zn ribbon nucleic-acid-binding protein